MQHRDPDQLPRVLLNLLAHPSLKAMLQRPQTLATFLRNQGWAPVPPEEMEDGPWAGAVEPDSQEAAEAAEMLPQLEEKLAEAALTPEQQETLKAALVQTCPECQETLDVLMPSLALT